MECPCGKKYWDRKYVEQALGWLLRSESRKIDAPRRQSRLFVPSGRGSDYPTPAPAWDR